MTTTTTALAERDLESAKQKGLALVQRIADLEVTDAASYAAAGALHKAIRQYRGWIDKDVTGPVRQAARRMVDVAMAQFRLLDDPAKRAEELIEGKIKTYDRQERERIAAEQARLQAEAQAEADLAATLDSEAAPDGLASEPTAPVPVFVPPPPLAPKSADVSIREHWKARVTDPLKLIRAVAEGRAPTECVVPNMSALNGLARVMKATLNLPGVEAYDEGIVAGRVGRA